VKQSYNLAKFTKSKIILMHVSATSDSERVSELNGLAETTRRDTGLEVETLSLKGDVYELTAKRHRNLTVH
jgi:hypothetical protein